MLWLGGMAVANRQDIDPKVFAAHRSRIWRKITSLELTGKENVGESIYMRNPPNRSYDNSPDPDSTGPRCSVNIVKLKMDLRIEGAELLEKGRGDQLRSKDMIYEVPPLYG